MALNFDAYVPWCGILLVGALATLVPDSYIATRSALFFIVIAEVVAFQGSKRYDPKSDKWESPMYCDKFPLSSILLIHLWLVSAVITIWPFRTRNCCTYHGSRAHLGANFRYWLLAVLS